MRLYRYTFNGEGVYEALRRKTGSSFSDNPDFNWLHAPSIYETSGLNLEAWFTEVGNMMFIQTTLPVIKRLLGSVDIDAREGVPGTPVYIDQYQIIIDKGICDWCDGGANDLLIGEVQCDIEEEYGIMRAYFNGKEVGQRRVNFCPMCGRPVGGAKDIDPFASIWGDGRD